MPRSNILKNQVMTARLRQRLLFASICFWVPVLIFIKISQEVLERQPILLDNQITQIVQSFKTPGLTNAAKLLTHGGDTVTIALITAVLVGGLLYRLRRRDALAVLVAVGGAGAINYMLKLFFGRARPDALMALVREASFSFPSGHAMGTAALSFALIIMLWRTKWRLGVVAAAVVYVLLTGCTRVYLGVHYPSDVIAGWCVSAVWVLTVYLALEHPTFAKSSVKTIFPFL